jgi:hypothetical protein
MRVGRGRNPIYRRMKGTDRSGRVLGREAEFGIPGEGGTEGGRLPLPDAALNAN